MNTNNIMLNLGTLGSVSDGKSEMIYQLSGIRTQRDSREKKRNITIKAGYANIKLWKCNECNKEYSTSENNIEFICSNCNENCNMIKHISFTDCPGHQELIDTMLTSISLVEGAIIVISVVEPLKNKPQLLQHLIAAKVSKLNKIIICLNKCDLVTIDIVKERKRELDNLLEKLDIKYIRQKAKLNILIPDKIKMNKMISQIKDEYKKHKSNLTSKDFIIKYLGLDFFNTYSKYTEFTDFFDTSIEYYIKYYNGLINS